MNSSPMNSAAGTTSSSVRSNGSRASGPVTETVFMAMRQAAG